jgi:hypothetical protein
VGLLIVVHPGVEVKSIEGDAAIADRDLGKERAYLGVEAIAVHPEVLRCVAVADEAREKCHPSLSTISHTPNGLWRTPIAAHSR